MRTEKKRVEEFAHKINDKQFRMRYVLGAFGDMEDCTGIVEEESFPEEGGAFVKYLGCSYWQKGCPLGMIPLELIQCYGLAKRILVRVATDFVQNKILVLFAFLFWLVYRQRFFLLLNRYASEIHERTIHAIDFDEKRYNKFPTELIRALRVVFKKETGKEVIDYLWKTDYLWQPEASNDHIEREKEMLKDKKLRLLVPLYKVVETAIFLLDFDTAYRYPAQDVLSGLDKTNDPVKELQRIMALFIRRCHPDYGAKEKAVWFSKSIPYLRFFPAGKRMLKTFFEELDIEKIKLDEEDWYWCLRRKLYNFNDVPIEERLKEAKRIDKEKDHVKVKFTPTASYEEFNEKSGIKKKIDNNLKNN